MFAQGDFPFIQHGGITLLGNKISVFRYIGVKVVATIYT